MDVIDERLPFVRIAAGGVDALDQLDQRRI